MPDILLERTPRTVTYKVRRAGFGISTPMDVARSIQLHKRMQTEPHHFSISEGNLYDRETKIPLVFCPQEAVSAVQVVEKEEIVKVRGGAWDVPVVEYHSLYAVYDNTGEPLGMIELSPNAQELTVLPADVALAKFGVQFPQGTTIDDIQIYLREVQTFFARLGELTMKSGIRFDQLVPIEIGLPFFKLLRQYEGFKDQIYQLVRSYDKDILDTLAIIQDEDQLQSLIALAKIPEEEKQYEVRRFVRANAEIKRDLPHIPVSSELEKSLLYKHLDGLYDSFVQVVLERAGRGEVDWNIVHVSQLAFRKMLDEMYHVPQASKVDLQPYASLLSDFASKNMGDPQGLQMILPALTASWHRYANSYAQGIFQKEAEIFYKTLGDYLDETASETTGDTVQERERMLTMTKELREKGFIGDHAQILDTGCRSGERLLRPYLTQLYKATGVSADLVVGMDLLQFPQPEDGLWHAVQADFSLDEFVARVGGNYDLVWNTWSPLADLSPRGQQRALNNFSRVGQIVVVDIPAGYLEEMEIYHQRHPDQPYGIIERAFETKEGRKAKKHFTINPLYEILGRATLAGFQVINGPEGPIQSEPAFWETGKGKKRLTLVLKKTGEPQASIDAVPDQKPV